jgi:hypothetical protein
MEGPYLRHLEAPQDGAHPIAREKEVLVTVVVVGRWLQQVAPA